ncbi:Cysteinyl-tRNA synthetase, partial [sediment metagenome]
MALRLRQHCNTGRLNAAFSFRWWRSKDCYNSDSSNDSHRMSLRLFNSLTRQMETFTPRDPQRVTMYVCGPTVYNYIHIGNARPPVVFGVLAQLLRARYPKVVYARNITDVDDKINAAACEQAVPISAITERFTAAYRD